MAHEYNKDNIQKVIKMIVTKTKFLEYQKGTEGDPFD